VFPSYPFVRHSDGHKIAEFIAEVPLHREINVEYDLRDDSDKWFVRLVPAVAWESILQPLEELRNQPRLEERYGISRDAAQLLEWIEGLQEKEYQGK
jgi:hypothetical protein